VVSPTVVPGGMREQQSIGWLVEEVEARTDPEVEEP
jgi:hypothetical protein